MIRYGILLEKDTAFDLDPFPTVPAGALKAGSSFLVEHGLDMLSRVGTANVYVVVDIGAVYLLEAITRWEKYPEVNFAYSSEVADLALPQVLDSMWSSMPNVRTKTLAIVPGNTISDLDMKKVEKAHNDRRKPPMTLVVTPGVGPEPYYNCPTLYRPTCIAIVEPSIMQHIKSKSIKSFYDIIRVLDEKDAINYYTHEGLIFEVDSEEMFSLISGTSSGDNSDDDED